MQIIIEAIKNVLGNSWFPIVGIALIIAFVYMWEMISGSEKFLRWWIFINPKNADAYLKLGNLLVEDDECFDEAEKEYKHAINLSPKSRQGYYQLHELYNKTKNIKDSDNLIERMMELFPEDPVVYVWKGGALAEKNNIKAEESFQKAIPLAPRSAFVYEQYGRFLLEQNRFADSENALTTAINIDPSWVRTYTFLILALNAQNKFTEAEKYARKFVKLQPKDSHPSYLLAYVLSLLDKHTEAISICNQIIKREPDFISAYSQLGEIYMDIGEYEKSRSMFRMVLEQNSDDATVNAFAHKGLGKIFLKQYLVRDAEDSFRKALSLDSKDKEANDDLVRLLRNNKRNEDALDVLYEALKHDPEYFIALMSIASIKKEQGKDEEANEYLKKSRPLIPKDENYWYNMACIATISRDIELAFKSLENASKEKSFDKTWAWGDSDLDPIKDNPRFTEIVGPKPEK